MPKNPKPRIVIFGASGRTGRLLARAFSKKGHEVVGVGRRGDVLATLPCAALVLDLENGHRQRGVTRPGDIVVNAAHARFTKAIASLCAPDIARFVVIGSTRYLTRFHDRKAQDVMDASAFLDDSKLPWVMLHPTMIYGADGENNVQRMAALIRRFHVVPLPDHGRALIQPVHVADVVEAVVAASLTPGLHGKTIHLGGPEPVPYWTFLEDIAKASGTWVRVLPLPLAALKGLAALSRIVPGVPPVTGAEVQRLVEDKTVDVTDMVKLLGARPRPLRQGLKETFRK